MPAKKIDLEVVKFVLDQNIEEQRTVANIMEDLRRQLEQEEAEKEKKERVKKQFVVLVSDPEKDLEGKIKTGWVLQIPEGDDPSTVEARLIDAALEFNTSSKGRKMPVSSIGDACEALPPRITKDHQVWIKTKEPIYLLRTDNKITLPDGL